MSIKKFVCWVVFSVCAFVALSVGARSDVLIETVSVDPPELSEAGFITVTFEISNHSESSLEHITISQETNLFECPEGTIVPAGGSARIPIAFPVEENRIGTKLLFSINWISNDMPFTENKEIIVNRSNEPVIELKRTVGSLQARTGKTVSIVYTLFNGTKFDMTDITLIDEQVSDSAILKNHVLRANDSYSADYTYIVKTEAVVSNPIVTYTVNGKTKTYSGLDPVQIGVSNASVLISADQKETASEGTHFVIHLENNGNVAAKNLNIYDSSGNKVNEKEISLEIGEKKKIDYIYPPLQSNKVQQVYFRYTGYDEMGELLDPANTGFYSVYPYIDETQFKVELDYSVAKEWSAETQTIVIAFEIQNTSSSALNRVVLSEELLGELYQWETLPNGVSSVRIEMPVEFPREMVFSISGLDYSGIQHELASTTHLVRENISPSETPDVTPGEEPIDTDTVPGIWSNPFIRVLIIFGALMVLSLSVMLALSVYEHAHADSSTYTDPDDDDEEDWDEYFSEPMECADSTDVPEDEYPEELQYPTAQRFKTGKKNMHSGKKQYEEPTPAPAPRSVEVKKKPRKLPRKKLEIKRVGHHE